MSKTMTWEEYSDELKVRLDDKTAELAKVKQQLAIAVEALELYKNLRGDGTLTNYEQSPSKPYNELRS